MIPHIIHYCWIGGQEMPELAQQCIASWHKYMPGWEYKEWTEESLTRALNEPIPGPCPKRKWEERVWLDYMPTYVKQAYEARKFAFVSDYVRLWALEQYGGLYMDVDFEVFRPFDDLMNRYSAFAGYEGSKRQPVMQGVIASEPHGAWVTDMLSTYKDRKFILPDGRLDMTPNTCYFTDRLEAQGFVADGVEKDFYLKGKTKTQINTSDEAININAEGNQKMTKNSHADEGIFILHVFPVHYFCPVLTTGEDVRTAETYCEHKGESSWAQAGWKARVLRLFGPKWKTRLIKAKRMIIG